METTKKLAIKGAAWLGIQAGAFVFTIIFSFLVCAAVLFVGIAIVDNYLLFEGLNPDERTGVNGLIIVAWTICCISATNKLWNQISKKAWIVFKRIDF